MTETKLETNYSQEADRTFIIKATYENGELKEETVVGFYSGGPDESDTKFFSNNHLTAKYLF